MYSVKGEGYFLRIKMRIFALYSRVPFQILKSNQIGSGDAPTRR